MNTINQPRIVAVTGVGAIIGQGIIRSLRASERPIRIIGVDRSAHSPGKFMVDIFEQKPEIPENTLEYLDFWNQMIKYHAIDLILPGLEIDMHFFNQHLAWLQTHGCVVALNSQELIYTASNKWRMADALTAIGEPVIPFCKPRLWGDALEQLGSPPFLMKPLESNGSRGIVKIRDRHDFAYWSKKCSVPWMLQRIVGRIDNEYTIGVFGFGDGSILGPIIFRRRLSNLGNTQEAEVCINHPTLEKAIHRLCSHFCPLGPTNLQFRLENDIAYLLEINPRFSSSNSLRAAFGFNEAAMCIDFYLDGCIPRPPTVLPGIAWRYFEDYVTYDSYPI